MGKKQHEMKKRLVEYANYIGLSPHAFETSCGLSNSYCANDNAVGTNAQKKITETYPDLNMTWVLTGIGSMSKSAPPENKNDLIVGLRKELEIYQTLYKEAKKENKGLLEEIGSLKARLESTAQGNGNK